MTDQAPKADAPNINLIDLQNALRIIDAAAERGAFRGSELTSVGGVRDKLAAFLETVLPQEEQVPEEEEAPAAKKKTSRVKK